MRRRLLFLGLLMVLMLNINSLLISQSTYTWVGTTNDFSTATNWTPERSTPATSDILQFNNGATFTITNVTSQTIGQLIVSNNSKVTLSASVTGQILTIGSITGTALNVDAGCELNISGSSTIQITLASNVTGSVSGSMTFSGGGHRLIVTDPNKFFFENGSFFTTASGFSGSAFGTTGSNKVIFKSGSAYVQGAGSHPYAGSVTIFNTASLYKHISSSDPSASGRTYADFEYDNSTDATLDGGSKFECENLIIKQSTLYFNMTGTLGHSIKGDITVQSGASLNFNPSTASTVNFNGSSQQTISGGGTITSNSNSTLFVDNSNGVILDNNANLTGNLTVNSGSLTIKEQRQISVSGTLTNNAGASGLVIESDNTGTGSLITEGSVSGEIKVERYIPGATEDWHLVSSPVSGQGITGDWVPAGSYGDGTGYDFYAWHEDGQTWVNRKNTIEAPNGDGPRFNDAIVNGNLNFNAPKGYMTSYQELNPTKSFVGAPYNSNQTYSLSRTGVGANAGLNLIGNPFPATISGNTNADATNNFLGANAAVMDDAYEAYYYWDSPSEDYVAINQSSAAHFIEVGQGFFVVAAADDAVLNFNTSLRKHGSATFYKDGDSRKTLLLTVNSENAKLNHTELFFDNNVTTGLDPGFDAAKLQGNTALSLYSFLPGQNDKKFAIQSLPLPSEEMIIPVGITVNTAGLYQMSLNPSLPFVGSITASLFDTENGISTPIEENTTVSFIISNPGEYNNRFLLHFGAVGIGEQTPSSKLKAYMLNGQLYFHQNGEAVMEVIDLQGRLLESAVVNGQGLVNRQVNQPAGVYVIRLTGTEGVQTAKVVVK